MKIDRIFLAYMALIGIVVGAILVAAPSVQDFVIKPYFWILIAVAVFRGRRLSAWEECSGHHA